MNAGSRLTLVTALPETSGGLASAACLAIAIAERARLAHPNQPASATVLIDGSGAGKRRPTLLASEAARRLESVVGAIDGVDAVARGSLCWAAIDESSLEALLTVAAIDQPLDLVAYLEPAAWRDAIEDPSLAAMSVLIRADRARHLSLCALLAAELRERRIAHSIQTARPGLVASRRALAGFAPGGEAEQRARRAARKLWPGLRAEPNERASKEFRPAITEGFGGESGQALPLMLGAAFVVLALAFVAIAIGSAGSAAGRVQRAADLAAVSAARSMRDDRSRLFEPARLPSGRPNPAALSLGEYESRASAVALRVAGSASIPPRRVMVSFPDAAGGAPTKATVEIGVELRGAVSRLGPAAPKLDPVEVEASATAEAVLDTSGATGGSHPVSASGDYSGPLAYRQGKPMRPDVAEAFDRMASAASADGVALTITSAYRSDAEQAALFAAHPDPQWVAPPGVSLHRCGTELDLGPSTAYGWLASNAQQFGFVQRYSWEAWHYGFTEGPAPCSAASSAVTRGDGGGAASQGGLPSFVPARFREPIATAASRYNVPAGLLAAQLMAESGFDPDAVSPAGALGIAQFIPSTAAAWGLGDPFDANAAIQAQARLMAANLRQFGSTELALAAYNAGPAPVAACHCVPPYPETQAYVARILDLMGGAAEVVPPQLEVRLVA